jgi:GGDEF domain-containing protein
VGEESGWTRFFFKKGITEEGEDFLTTLFDCLAGVFEAADEEGTGRRLRNRLKGALACDDISVFVNDPTVKPSPNEGAWVLSVRSGFGEGNSVCQADALRLPDLEPGQPVPFDEDVAQQAALKAIALAFEEDTFYGCDIEKKIVLLKNPKPEDDLGSGDLSVLALPLRYRKKVGRVTEKTRVGVLALFKTPVRRELGDVEESMRSLLAQALVAPRCQLRDPITGLYTESFLKEELRRYMSLHALTQGKLNGGFVVGMVDTLKLYKQTLETSARIDPNQVSQCVSDVLQGVGGAIQRRCTEHTLDAGTTYEGGFGGRIGHEGFGVVLPLLQPGEQCMWAVRLAKEVISARFAGEEFLDSGDVTVSLRVIPFAKGSVDDLWGLAERALEDIEAKQLRARRDEEALRQSVNQIRVFSGGRWLTTGEFVNQI